MLPALTRLLNDRFLDRLVATPRGRAFLLGFMTENEEADEAGVFDHLLLRVGDPELHQLVRVHRDDEDRHARILQACVDRTPAAVERLPADQRILPIVDRHLGGFAAGFVGDRRSVMEAYLLLQVIEERAVYQYPFIEKALRRVDPESAAVVAGVIRDEARHVKYCKAISKRYAPDEATRTRTLTHFRDVEAQAFAEHGAAMLAFVLEKDLIAVGPLEKTFWRTLARLDAHRSATPIYTPFATSAAAQ